MEHATDFCIYTLNLKTFEHVVIPLTWWIDHQLYSTPQLVQNCSDTHQPTCYFLEHCSTYLSRKCKIIWRIGIVSIQLLSDMVEEACKYYLCLIYSHITCILSPSNHPNPHRTNTLLKVFLTWWFLELNHLLVIKLASVVNQSHAVFRLAVLADAGFGYTAAIDLHRSVIGTYIATEESFPHFWHQLWGSDDHSTDSYQFINIWRDKMIIALQV